MTGPTPTPTPPTPPTPAAAPAAPRRAKKLVESEGIAHITATFNNTLVTITDLKGNAIVWGSAGKSGFKGSKKSTSFAATVAAEQCAREAANLGVRRVHVRVQGPGAGRSRPRISTTASAVASSGEALEESAGGSLETRISIWGAATVDGAPPERPSARTRET